MSTVAVFVCPGAAESGTCEAGAGSWQNVSLTESFDPALLDVEALGAAWSVGFTVMGIGLTIAWAARIVLAAVKG